MGLAQTINWLPAVKEDLEQLDRITAHKLVVETLKKLNLDPAAGEAIGEKEWEASEIKRIKPIRGYWVVYYQLEKRLIVAAILPCKREIARGDKNPAARVAQIRKETEEEFKKLKGLLSK